MIRLRGVPAYRRITLSVGLAMFIDSTLYLAVLPLLPRFAERFDLGTLGVALVLVSYPAATPFISLAAIPLVPRLGPRRIALASTVLMTLATVAFALAPNAAVLIAARFLQGVASGTVWTSSMSWVTHNAPDDRRGRETGIVMGCLAVGSVCGPGIGALAAWLGFAPAFLLVAALSAVTVVITAFAPRGSAPEREADLRASMARALRNPLARAALAMALIDPLAFGSVDLLVPLGLGRGGTSTFAIAAALTGGALLGAIAGPLGGRLVDRIGPTRVALPLACTIALVPIPLAFGPPAWAQLALLVVLSPVFAVAASAMFPLGSAGADAAGVAHIVVAGMSGACWAAGFTVSPLLAGAIADGLGRGVAFTSATLLCLPLLGFVVLAARPRAAASSYARG